ncbi:hypothetical protein BCR36DRAFT_374854 [Piromyces finnis]|uniref:CBM1 domain-containing protein n=1 Tax=Piromyces finnis TaxID=1754191 RepID=A0A1Y1UVM3_9FUNG|nr:hypothetical protein BCR36DRAFT_374854 [Piromyces finnis]|eukprot:ORX41987.1 hypothetical protein BCR36DRAFT_374854 [Piromyces finnis]
MQFKNTFVTLVVLLCAAFASVNATVCRTQKGVAWCEGTRCWKRDTSTFTRTYCSSASVDGTYQFNGSNCRRCPSTSCAIVTKLFHGSLPAYHSANGYVLTSKGWCYYG